MVLACAICFQCECWKKIVVVRDCFRGRSQYRKSVGLRVGILSIVLYVKFELCKAQFTAQKSGILVALQSIYFQLVSMNRTNSRLVLISHLDCFGRAHLVVSSVLVNRIW